jgi:hypothetical protein
MRYVVVYEEDRVGEDPVYFRFACETLSAAEVWALDAIHEGPRNQSRTTIYEFARPTVRFINIDGEAVRIDVPVPAKSSAMMPSV